MAELKNYTLRLDAQLGSALELAARADGMSIAEWLRRSVADSLDERSSDPEFYARLRQVLEEDRQVLDHLLAKGRATRSGSTTRRSAA
jgi:hypothetical protein